MKKTLLFSALLSSMLVAGEKMYEVSPMVGYNFTEGNVGLKDNGHFFGGVELQFNTPDSKLSPEFSLYYSPKAKYDGGGDTPILRGAFNGVYTFDSDGAMVPFAKAGFGIEGVEYETPSNDTGFFVDAGAGVKYFWSENIALKAEAIYLAKLSGNHNSRADKNLMALVGVTFAFGDTAQKEPVMQQEEKKEEVVAVVAQPVELDDDHDGIANTQDQCQNTPAGVKVSDNGCEIDSDNDGVVDSQDKCVDTLAGTKVDTNGCALDSDKDGIVDAQDICPNTPLGDEVNSDGCPKEVTLNITFANNSAEIQAESDEYLDTYAEFLKKHTNYSANIVGYSDSRGNADYNKKLSYKRAKSVVDALLDRGVAASQLSYAGRGEENPIASNETAEGRAQNRRIEAELTRN